jgi:outer membrane receptor protein involved in Fe transport
MASKQFNKTLKRSALTVALGLCFAGGVQAQSSVGTIFGDTTANATVKIENLDTGSSREITSDASGRFTFPQLAPGRYRVTSPSGTREVQVKVGTGTQVTFATPGASELGAVTVVGTAGFNPIDVSSVESTTVFTAEQIQELPIGRDVTNVALLAPGTVRGDTGLGNLASFGGASVAENGYYINGFDVTNIRTFLSFANLPFDAIGEQQVKTGGYGAEYGRSLGGVISIVTKRGTNEWTGGVSAYWTPESLREPGKDVMSKESGATSPFVYRSANTRSDLSYNIWGGGPLVKDRLFAFALVQGQDNEVNTFGDITSSKTNTTTPTGMVKLDWNITDNHVLEFTGIQNKVTDDVINYQNPDGIFNSGVHGTLSSIGTVENGGQVYIGKYTGYLTDSFTLSVLGGYLKNTNNFASELPGADCPRIYDSRADINVLEPLGCWSPAQPTVRDPAFGGGGDKDTRKAYRIDGEWRLGDHNLRFGYDHEQFTSSHAGVEYSGGVYYRYFGEFFWGPAYAFEVVRTRHTHTESGTFKVTNAAAYLEDSWQATDNLLLYAGVRGETFENQNARGQTFVESDTLYAPRVGFSWDVNGDSSFKVFGNAGRYYIPVASNTNIRATSAEYSDEQFNELLGVNPDGTPIIGPVLPFGELSVNGSFTPPDPRTVASTNLDPMYQDEFILGFQREMGAGWTLGARAIRREVKNGMDDYCSHNGFQQWARDNATAANGFDAAQGNAGFAVDGVGVDMASCVLVNPGKDVSLAMDPDNNGTLEVYTVPATYLGLPEYLRKYAALELFWEKAKSNNWYLQGSYTFAKSKGNVEGYVNSTLEQVDAGLTQDFDNFAFEQGSYGYLPNDRRHTLKLFGAYDLSDEWTVSANLLVQSGRPVNCNGFVPVGALGIGNPDAGTLSAYSASSFYCPDPNGNLVDNRGTASTADDVRYTLGNRGDRGRTPWTRTVDLGVTYSPTWADGKLELGVRVFNLFNAGTVTEYNETSQITRADKTTSPNFLNDVNYQTPRFVRFTARYSF